MFVKFIIVLLLLIALVSLLRGGMPSAGSALPAASRRPGARSLMLRIAIALLALGVAVLVLHLSGCTAHEESPFKSTLVRNADYGRLASLDGLTDHAGQRVTHVDFSGRVVLVFFGYTQCPDICPTTLLTLQAVMRQLGPEAQRLQVVFVTLDPARDTPDILAPYISFFDKNFRALRGDESSTQAVAKEFRAYYSKVPRADGSYTLDHTATSYVFDPQGRLRLLIRHGETAENITADLRLLLADK